VFQQMGGGESNHEQSESAARVRSTCSTPNPKRTPVQLDAGQIQPALKVTDPAKTLDKIVDSYRKVTSDDAKAKHRGRMAHLGVPDWQVSTTGTSSPFLYPVHLAIAQRGSTERVVAIDAFRSRPDHDLGHELTKGNCQRPPVVGRRVVKLAGVQVPTELRQDRGLSRTAGQRACLTRRTS
jgi:hypothetical protein